MYRKYGPIARQTIGGDTVVYLFNPEDIKVCKTCKNLSLILTSYKDT